MAEYVLDHGYVEFIESWGNDERIIESARMSTGKGFIGWGTDEIPGDERLLRYLHTNKHLSPFEMAGMTIEVQAPIFVFREWMRHRTASYSEMSARYMALPDYSYVPTVERLMMTSNGNKQSSKTQGTPDMTAEKAERFLNNLVEMYDTQQQFYEEWLNAGVPKELARIDLPVGRYSRMRASANLRNWLAFMTLRCDKAAQWEIRQYANIVAKRISELFPRTYELWANENHPA